MPTPQSPVAAVFGPEVADDISKNKSLLKQCTEALVANGIAVVLPPSFLAPEIVAGGPHYSGTPYDIEVSWLKSLQAAVRISSLTLLDGSAVKLIKVTALKEGTLSPAITVTVAAGSISGKKITITDGVTPEVYDDLADVDAAITAIEGVSLLVSAAKLANGTLANIAATPLAGGVSITAPTFALGENDNQSIFIAKWAKAIFDALRTAGYIA
jgi:hypothetical protein